MTPEETFYSPLTELWVKRRRKKGQSESIILENPFRPFPQESPDCTWRGICLLETSQSYVHLNNTIYFMGFQEHCNCKMRNVTLGLVSLSKHALAG